MMRESKMMRRERKLTLRANRMFRRHFDLDCIKTKSKASPQRDVATTKTPHRRDRRGAQRYAGKAKSGGSSSPAEISPRPDDFICYHSSTTAKYHNMA